MKNPPHILDELRDIPLTDLLRWQGLEPQREGQSFRAKNWQYNIVTTGQRWYDNAASTGGAGAIDLYMHLSGANFPEACTALGEAFPARIAYQGFTSKPKEKPTKPTPQRVPFHLLIARYATRDESKWLVARHYLVHTRGISEELIERMHGEGLIYANNHSPLPSLVFLHRTLDGGVAGATLRDVTVVSGSRFCPTLGDKLSAWFSVGDVEAASKIVAVESPIDALSYHCLRPDLLSSVAVVSCGGANVPVELMGTAYERRKSLVLALDNDQAGAIGTRRAQERVSAWEDFPVSVERPQRKDWNEDLAAIRTAQVASMKETPPCTCKPQPHHPMELSATYSPEDNKLRLYASSRLDKETYSQLKQAGFSWAPKQELFVAPAWSPNREDLLLELCGTIEDEDKSLVQRAEERAERFGDYSDNRAKDAEQARKMVDSIAEQIPFGQPILVGHHSERRARKDAERIDSGTRKTVQNWESSKYWEERARGVLQAAKYKERPDVRARRIKKLEAELRKMESHKEEAERFVKAWSIDKLTMPLAAAIASRDHGNFLSAAERTDGKSWPVTLWDATQGRFEPQPDVKEIAARAIQNNEKTVAWADRWINHLTHRLGYERMLLKEQGGIAADQVRPEKGGACKCWASPRGGWSIIQKVNKVSVTVLDNWGNGGADFPRTMPFDKLTGLMSKAEVDAARQAGQLVGRTTRGFFLGPKQGQDESASQSVKL